MSPTNRHANGSRGISIDKTQIIPCNVSHRRIFPKRRQFLYSYLSVGIAVRSPDSGWLLSVDVAPRWKRGFLHVTAEDHLHPDGCGNTLSKKLDNYLIQEGLNPDRYPYVYLLTSARFLNYKFSPASFWYLYTEDRKLEYVIAEVNNTFDERRMYLFQAQKSGSVFRQTCQKDFHVSPFNSRKGTYELRTTNPSRDERISVHVTLHSSKGHPKLVTRWWQVAPAIEPCQQSILRSMWFLACWGWTVPITFPRIVFQAILLAQVDRLGIWYRPEPRESAIPRQATSSEKMLASILDCYLESIVRRGPEQASVSISHHPLTQQRSIVFDMIAPGLPASVELRVHTPQFYRQMITYPSLSEYLCSTLLNPSEENRTAWCDNANHLITVVTDLEFSWSTDRSSRPNGGYFGPLYYIWAAYGRSSVRRLNGVYPDRGTPRARKCSLPDPKGGCGSDSTQGRCFLDNYVYQSCPWSDQLFYVFSVLHLRWRTKLLGIVGGE
ncbi:hypothetical protein GGR56DRAFT_665999 [Xylariaceae sp. FL0804]|nr:hypothetical protein GGR56DRAFT_665999 [Xylariaceae sp. FL0804]